MKPGNFRMRVKLNRKQFADDEAVSLFLNTFSDLEKLQKILDSGFDGAATIEMVDSDGTVLPINDIKPLVRELKRDQKSPAG